MAVRSGVYRGVPAADRVAERRAKLLAAGLAVWADPDTRTTMTAVCARAGLSERYFYESFTGLDALLEAVMDGIAAEIEATSRKAADAATGGPAERVRAAVRAFVDLLLDDPRKGRVAIVESVAVPKLRQRRTELLRYLAHQSAVEAQRLFGTTVDDVAGLLFIGGMAELVTAWLDGTVDASADEIVDAATRALLSSTAESPREDNSVPTAVERQAAG
ncbi:TetR/AcrR family transcriptional regulator [Cryptosporangium sp. NPDC048952]|uniref:TetR/AcrR family transcriptional regulator n=1 Tax=Cryptosporangium sp. NPDC048952 TaxID=3363961 RepID=UPI0037237713